MRGTRAKLVAHCWHADPVYPLKHAHVPDAERHNPLPEQEAASLSEEPVEPEVSPVGQVERTTGQSAAQ